MSDARHVVIVSPNWLGDAVMALPAIQDVRRCFPDARITMAARAPVASLFALVPAVDDVLVLEWRGRWWDRRGMRRDLSRLRERSPGMALLLTNSFATAWLVNRAGIPERLGYRRDLRGPLLTRAVPRPRGGLHQGAYYQHLTTALDMPAGPLEPEIAVTAAAVDAAEALLRANGWDGGRPLVVLAPGAAYGKAKQWPPRYFATLISRLVAHRAACCVIVGSAADGATAGWIRQHCDDTARTDVIDLTGRTSLEILAAILTIGQACVSNDSGAMHLAAAAGIPVAALFGPTREDQTAPLARQGGRTQVLLNPVWCRPCMLRECPLDHRCMYGLEPSRVQAAVVDLMTGPRAPHLRERAP
jgi:heptosyltransferase-2